MSESFLCKNFGKSDSQGKTGIATLFPMNVNSWNVASHLARLAATEPYRLAVVYPHGRDSAGRVAYTHWTFLQLHEDSDRLAHGLKQIGIDAGTRTVLMVTPSLDFFSLTFALFKLGAIPVLIDPGMGIQNLGICLAEAEPEAFIGIPKANVARKILGWGRSTIRKTITTGSRFLQAQYSLQQLRKLGAEQGSFPRIEPQADDMAAILFTSGSTGVAKGVVYTHGIFTHQVRMLQTMYGIQPGEVDLATFPLFALFGPALGMTAIIPDMDASKPAKVDPKKIIEAIHNFGVTNLFGSPALVNRVGRYGTEHPVQLPSLKRVISAGAPVPATVIERFTTLLSKQAEVHTPYGATESLPVASIGSKTLLTETRPWTEQGAGVCVGHPVEGMQVRILPIHEQPIAEWEEQHCLPIQQIGEITVTGPVVTKQYYHRDAATKLAKILDPKTGAIWHRMGDVGYLDARGRIWFCGRKSHRVITEQGTLFTIPCEAVFNLHPAIFRTALVGVRHQGKRYPVLCVECESGQSIRATELHNIASRYGHTKMIQTFLQHPKFPVDIRHNAKIFREKLALWAEKRLQKQGWQPTPLTEAIPHPPTFQEVSGS